MILATHGFLASSISGIDADYQAILDYATTQGYTLPSAGQQALQNQLVVDLKAGGIWSKLDTFGVFATDGNSDFALIDWIRLSQYTAVNSPSFTTNTGFAGNGTSAYIDTNFNLLNDSVNYTDADASRYMYLYNASGSAILDGTSSSSTYNRILISNTTSQTINSTNSLDSQFNFNANKGIKSIHRTSSNDVSLYNDKVGDTRTQAYIIPALRNENQFILRRSTAYSSNEISMYAMGASLVAQNDDFVDAFDTYINSL